MPRTGEHYPVFDFRFHLAALPPVVQLLPRGCMRLGAGYEETPDIHVGAWKPLMQAIGAHNWGKCNLITGAFVQGGNHLRTCYKHISL